MPIRSPRLFRFPAGGAALPHLFSLKSLTLVVATTLSFLGSAGQSFLVDTWDDVVEARTTEMREIENRISTLRETQSEYYNAYVQGNLLFALNPADESRNRGVVGKLYQLSLYDRAFPFRSILAELALAGAFDFTTTNDTYRKLHEAARGDLTFASYVAVNNFERDILQKALDLQHALQDRYFAAQKEKAAAEQSSDKRKVWLIALTAVGTCLLLVANLLVGGKTEG